jgi:hypothetical protein
MARIFRGLNTDRVSQLWILVVQKRPGGSIDASGLRRRRGVVSAALGQVCNSRRTHVGCYYALIAAISGLVPMMFMTRVIL